MEPPDTPQTICMEPGPSPGFDSKRRFRKIRASPKHQKKNVAAWLADRPVTCGLVGAADLDSGTKGETRKLYAAWKQSAGPVRLSFPFFERVFHTLLEQEANGDAGKEAVRDGDGPGPEGTFWRPGRNPWAYAGDLSTSWTGTALKLNRLSPVSPSASFTQKWNNER